MILGDPAGIPHPINGIAYLAKSSERFFRSRIDNMHLAGALTFTWVVAMVFSISWAILYVAGLIHPGLEFMISVYLIYSFMALRSLMDHSENVRIHLLRKDIAGARISVGMMVGRETAHLSVEEIIRATVESVAENFVDAVCAPLCFLFILGPLGFIIYKTVNLMDSLFGYKNLKYHEFGYLSAKMDDALNFVPARLSILVLPVSALLLGHNARQSLLIGLRDRLNHPSPNSAHAEAAVAGALGIQLGGPVVYQGVPGNKPFIGEKRTKVLVEHISKTNHLVLLSSALVFLIFYAMV